MEAGHHVTFSEPKVKLSIRHRTAMQVMTLFQTSPCISTGINTEGPQTTQKTRLVLAEQLGKCPGSQTDVH